MQACPYLRQVEVVGHCKKGRGLEGAPPDVCVPDWGFEAANTLSRSPLQSRQPPPLSPGALSYSGISALSYCHAGDYRCHLGTLLQYLVYFLGA